MSRLVICMCGGPCTGKSTTARDLKKYFEEVLGKGTVNLITDNRKVAPLTLFKWASVNKQPIAILDDATLTVFDRMELFDAIEDVPNHDDIFFTAIYHDRSWKFAEIHNRDDGHQEYKRTQLASLINLDQRPIRAEGFSVVYHVNAEQYLNIPGYIRMVNTVCETNYPVPANENDAQPAMQEEPAVSNEAVAETAAE